MASTIWGVQDLIVKHREVKSKAKADGVGGGQLARGDAGGRGVSLKSLGSGFLADIAILEFRQISEQQRK